MKKLFLSFGMILLYLDGIAQPNLVPNYSFENYTICPQGVSLIDTAHPWHNANYGSADLFNACAGSGSSTMGVPINGGGYQLAKTGVGYAGIFAYSGFPNPNWDYKEYIEAPLDSTLLAGNKYCISFFVNYSLPYYNFYNLVSITEIGLYLSDTDVVDMTMGPLPFTPQIVSPPGVFLNDTVNWYEISGLYTAHGGEKYIIIGNFKPFGQTDTLNFAYAANSLEHSAYYLIDDVSVIDCTNEGVEEIDKDVMKISPNPATSTITIETKNSTIENIHIYNVVGCEMLNRVQHDERVTIDVSGFAKGIYFVEAETEKGMARKKFVKE